MFALNNKMIQDVKIIPAVDSLKEKAQKETTGLVDKVQRTVVRELPELPKRDFSKAYTKPPEAGKKVDVKL